MMQNFIAVAAVIATTVCADEIHFDNEVPVGKNFAWTVDATTGASPSVTFEFELAPDTWMGIGLGAHEMAKSQGADMIMCSSTTS